MSGDRYPIHYQEGNASQKAHAKQRFAGWSDILRIPRLLGAIFRLIEGAWQQNSIAADPLTSKSSDCPPRSAETRCFASIKAHVCRRLSHLTRSPGHAGAGGARSRAISGSGSPGQEITRFGALTRAALARLQAAAGITPSAGYFGPKTRAYVAAHP